MAINYMIGAPDTIMFQKIFCRRLCVQVPWRSLKSEPVDILFDGVIGIVGEPDEITPLVPTQELEDYFKVDGEEYQEGYFTDLYENATIRFTDFSCYFQLKCDSPVNKITNPNPSTAIPYTTIAFCLDALKIFSVNEKGEKKDLSELRKDNKERILKSIFKKIEFGNGGLYFTNEKFLTKKEFIAGKKLKDGEQIRFGFFEPWSGMTHEERDWKTNQTRSIKLEFPSLSINTAFSTDTFDSFLRFASRLVDCIFLDKALRETRFHKQFEKEKEEKKKKERKNKDVFFKKINGTIDEKTKKELETHLKEYKEEVCNEVQITPGQVTQQNKDILKIEAVFNIVRFIVSINDIVYELTKVHFSTQSLYDEEEDKSTKKKNIYCLYVQANFQLGDMTLSVPLSKTETRKLLSHPAKTKDLINFKFYHSIQNSKQNTLKEVQPSEVQLSFSSLLINLDYSSVNKLAVALGNSFFEFIAPNKEVIIPEGAAEHQEFKDVLTRYKLSNSFFAEWMNKFKCDIHVNDVALAVTSRSSQLKFSVLEVSAILGMLRESPAADALSEFKRTLYSSEKKNWDDVCKIVDSAWIERAGDDATPSVNNSLTCNCNSSKTMVEFIAEDGTVYEIVHPFDLRTRLSVSNWNEVLSVFLGKAKKMTRRPVVSVSFRPSSVLFSISKFEGLGKVVFDVLQITEKISEVITLAQNSREEMRAHKVPIAGVNEETEIITGLDEEVKEAYYKSSSSYFLFFTRPEEKKYVPVSWKQIADICYDFEYNFDIAVNGVGISFDLSEKQFGMLLDYISSLSEQEWLDSTHLLKKSLLLLTVSNPQDPVIQREGLSEFLTKKIEIFDEEERVLCSSESSEPLLERDETPENEAESDRVFVQSNAGRDDLFRFHFVVKEIKGSLLFLSKPTRFLLDGIVMQSDVIVITPIKDQFNIYITSQPSVSDLQMNKLEMKAFGYMNEQDKLNGRLILEQSNCVIEVCGIPTSRLSKTIDFMTQKLSKLAAPEAPSRNVPPEHRTPPSALVVHAEADAAEQSLQQGQAKETLFWLLELIQSQKGDSSTAIPFVVECSINDCEFLYGTFLKPPPLVHIPGRRGYEQIVTTIESTTQEPEIHFRMIQSENSTIRTLKENLAARLEQNEKQRSEQVSSLCRQLEQCKKENEDLLGRVVDSSCEIANLRVQGEQLTENAELYKLQLEKMTALYESLKSSDRTMADVHGILARISMSAAEDAKDKARLEAEISKMKKEKDELLAQVKAEKRRCAEQESRFEQQREEHRRREAELEKKLDGSCTAIEELTDQKEKLAIELRKKDEMIELQTNIIIQHEKELGQLKEIVSSQSKKESKFKLKKSTEPKQKQQEKQPAERSSGIFDGLQSSIANFVVSTKSKFEMPEPRFGHF